MHTKTPSNLHLKFTSFDTSFELAAKEYEDIWEKEGNNIVKTMEHFSGLTFTDTNITVIVFEGISHSGNRNSPMKLRASYNHGTKRATLIHKLGHRLHFAIKNYPTDFNDHNLLFLYLYDVWVELYEKKFASEQVQIEYKRTHPKK
jgi:hypothetical protein